MSKIQDRFREEFRDEEYRYGYVEAHLNSVVACQIKKFRGGMSQGELAAKIGTTQAGVSRIEDVNYAAWNIGTLRKLARAFGLRLCISFEEFGTLAAEVENFPGSVLERRRFEDDPVFSKGAEDCSS